MAKQTFEGRPGHIAGDEGKGESEEINLQNAIRTAFSEDGDTPKFLERAEAEIRQVENEIIGTCAKHRIRLEDNLHTLLESRDGISEQVNDLNKTNRTASDMTASIENRLKEIYVKQMIRQNLDDALKIAVRTRQLTRMYAQIERVMTDNKNINCAFEMYKVFEREMKNNSSDLFLQDVIPNPNVLKLKIVDQLIHHYFLHWFPAVQSYEASLGAYALHHATVQISSLQIPKGPLGKPYDLLPLLNPASSPQNPSPHILHPPTRPWRPALSNIHEADEHPSSSSPSSQDSAVSSTSTSTSTSTPEPTTPAQTSDQQQSQQAPKLYLRPLLHAVHVADELDLLAHMRAEYMRRRASRLRAIIADYDSEASKGARANDAPTSDTCHLCASRVEALVSKVAGFFVVERTVELHARHPLVSREVVDEDWWTLAYAKLLSVFKAFDEGNGGSRGGSRVGGATRRGGGDGELDDVVGKENVSVSGGGGVMQGGSDTPVNVDVTDSVTTAEDVERAQRRRVSGVEARFEQFAEVNRFLS